MRALDLTGFKNGRLSVLGRSTRRDGTHVIWRCVCECGKKFLAPSSAIKRGDIRSCGCLQKEMYRDLGLKNGKLVGRKSNFYKHGHGVRGDRLYSIWRNMKYRCERKTNRDYDRYGGSGIRFCERWRKFENFLADMGTPPSNKHTLDRIDGTKGYNKKNCRWVTRHDQARNIRSNIWVTHNGKTMILRDWSTELGIPHPTLYFRYKRGLTPAQVLSKTKLPRGLKERSQAGEH